MKLPPRSADMETFGRLFLQVYDWDMTSTSDLLWEDKLNISEELLKGSETGGPFKITPTNNSKQGKIRQALKQKQEDVWNEMKDQYKEEAKGGEKSEKEMSKEVQRWAKSTHAAFSSLSEDKKAILMRDLGWDLNGLPPKTSSPLETTPLIDEAPDIPWWAICSGRGSSKSNGRKKKKARNNRRPASQTLAGGLKDLIGVGDDPENSQWVGNLSKRQKNNCCPCFSKNSDRSTETKVPGAMLISMEAVPMSLARSPGFEAGDGRNEPNMNPRLPPPSGRIDPMQLMNPFFLLGTLVGPEVAAELCCCFGCLIFLVLMLYVGPLILDMTELALMLPNAIGVYLIIVVCISACCACSYIIGKLQYCCRTSNGKDDEDSDDGDRA